MQKPIEFIDFEALRAQVSNYGSLFDKLIELFLEQAPLWVRELDEACAEQDPARVRQICHKIKGGAATLHAGHIIEAASALSGHAVAGTWGDAEPSRANLVSVISGTVTFVRAAGHGKAEC